MYPPHHLGGYELMWRSAVAHLRAAGDDVRVLTSDHRAQAPDAAIPEDLDVHRELRWYWREHGFPRLGALGRLALERHNASVFERHVSDFRPDAVCWWAMGGMSLSLIGRARRAGLASAGVVVDDWLLYGPQVDAWTRAFAHRPRAGALIERLTGIPAPVEPTSEGSWLFASETLRRRAAEAGHEPAAGEVAHPGVDLDLFRAAPEEDWRWRLLYCGRIDERKGIDTAIHALAELPGEATLRVVGGGDEEHLAELKRLAVAEGLGERVGFERRPRDELPSVYAAADAVLFPVRWVEPFGLVPLEAMGVGRPVVATGAGGSGEYLRDRENCLLFDADGDGPALAGAVRALAGDPALRSAVREAGLATAAAHPEQRFNAAVRATIERA